MKGRRDKPSEFEHVCYVLMAKIDADIEEKALELSAVNARLIVLQDRRAELETLIAFSPEAQN